MGPVRVSVMSTILWALTSSFASAQADSDGDGVLDHLDNCSVIANPDQRDTNGDGFGNICDPDLNNDQIVNPIDLGIFRGRFFTSDADADFNGDGIVNPIDLGVLRAFFFSPPGPGATPTTYANHAQPIFLAKCNFCHTTQGFGDHNIASSYGDTFLPADDFNECAGLNVGQCTIVLIQLGEMPIGAGCSGDPALDAGNPDCLTQAEQDTIAAWISGGLLE